MTNITPNEPTQQKYLIDGVYTLEITMEAGQYIKQHKHKYNHTSILAQGVVELIVDGVFERHVAPKVLSIPSGINHEIFALEPSVWYCIHAPRDEDATLETVETNIIES